MEFTLYYRGPLKPNGDRKEKHRLRQYFHHQLKKLWTRIPLSEQSYLLYDPGPYATSAIKRIDDFRFASLVNTPLHLTAELRITLLRPGQPGDIITHGGDIDNRLKTLFDALKIPERNELPGNMKPWPGENPFFCLLEDDKLITSISVATYRLLDPLAKNEEVVLFLHVQTKATKATNENLALL